MSVPSTDDQSAAAGLRSIPGATPSRLRELLAGRTPSETMADVASSRRSRQTTQLCGRWPELIGAGAVVRDLSAEVGERCRAIGAVVTTLGGPGYPAALNDDPAAPPVLFSCGSLDALHRRRVAIIGTRNATPAGRRVAQTLGDDLASAGVCVVSGLARGIDGAAHHGVRDAHRGASEWAAPAAVVGSGLDVTFPRTHRDLWSWLCADGLILSEHPPGTAPLAAHFPQRNRIIAALAEVVVVVESRSSGGSLITVREAIRRGVGVMAVPGSVLSPASHGTNALLADGAAAVRDADDVLVALGLDHRRAGTLAFDPRVEPSERDRGVLAAFGGDTLTIDALATRLTLPIVDVALAVGRLEAGEWLVDAGGWFQPIGPRHAVM